jgi:integrase
MAIIDKKHLFKRGEQWYLKLPIPRPLQRHFLTSNGKPKGHIIESLGDSLTQAQLQRNRRVMAYEAVFTRLRAGEEMTPDQIKTAVSLEGGVYGWESHFPKGVNYSELYKIITAAMIHGQATTPKLVTPPTIIEQSSETISQAAAAWLTETQQDTSTATKRTTMEGHRQRVGVFIKQCGDLPLSSINRAMASDFLASIGKTNRTINNYGTTLACVFRSAKDRGRFSGDNPFERHRRKVNKKTNRVPFEVSELQTLFDAMPRDIRPTKHTPETALPWVTLIGLFTGMRLEELCQLKADDIRDQHANGATVTIIDVHNGSGNSLKNESAVRLVPVHSELVRAGLLDYVKTLPKGSLLFPGLTRRTSKGDKIGARVGELFSKKLTALNLKREGLCFHSLRHTVAGRLDAAEVRKSDAARILGHTVEGETFGTYSDGPGLKVLAGVIEAVTYPGLSI